MIRTNVQSCNSPIIADNFIILRPPDNNVDLRILEYIFIHKQKPV